MSFRSRHTRGAFQTLRRLESCILPALSQSSFFFVHLQAGHRIPLRLAALLLFLTFLVIPADQTCEQKSSEMNYALTGHAYNATVVDEYPLCLKTCLGDGNCASFNYNFVTLLCELSNKTKVMEPASFIEKEYSTYTEVLR